MKNDMAVECKRQHRIENDAAIEFRRVIRKLPEQWIRDMRLYLSESGSRSKVIQKIILTISVELLRRKWTKDLT